MKVINKNIKSDPEEIWEALNNYCHKKFGFEDQINQSADSEDLQWAVRILHTLASWNKMNDFQTMINLWIEKINRYMIKTNVERHIILSPYSSESPLSFNFKTSTMFNNNKNLLKQKEKGKAVNININNLEDINEQMEDIGESSKGMY